MEEASRFFRGIFGNDARMPASEPLQRPRARVFAISCSMRQHGSKLGIGSIIQIFLPASFGNNQSQTQRRKSCDAGGRWSLNGASALKSLTLSGDIGCGFKARNFGTLRSSLQALFPVRDQ